MEFSRILLEQNGRISSIILNRPEKRNALDDVMVGELTSAFSSAGRSPHTKVILLKANGPAFCAGADLEYLSRVARFDLEENRKDSGNLANLFRTIHELRKPVIAVVGGAALAGGCGLASVCDFVIASDENARFGYTEVHIGFIPAIVLVFLMKRVGEGRARELVLGGNIITAREAYSIGLVTRVVPHDDLDAVAASLAEDLVTNNSATAMGICKEMLSKLPGMNVTEALDFAANMNAASRMTADCKNGIESFLNKKKISW